MSYDPASQLVPYLMKTGPIPLKDLVVRTSDPRETLRQLIDLNKAGEVEFLHGNATIISDLLDRLNRAVHARHASESDRAVLTVLDEVPAARQILVSVSEKSFRRHLAT